MCKWFVPSLLYFLLSRVCFCYMTWFSAHLCLQLWWWWWSRDLFSLASVCLQSPQSVCGWWEVVSLCEDWLLADQLSFTTLVTWMCWWFILSAITSGQCFTSCCLVFSLKVESPTSLILIHDKWLVSIYSFFCFCCVQYTLLSAYRHLYLRPNILL